MQFELREIQRRLGITSILVTHDQEEALTMSDRVAVMAHGEVMQIGSPTEVYDRPRTRFVSEFLGTANIFTGTVGADGHIAVDAQPGAAPRQGRRVTFAVRPENLVLGPPGEGTITAKVQDIVFRGAYFAYELTIEGQDQPLFAYAQKRRAIPGDGAVGVSWDPASAIVLDDAA
jgi:ABC-type Fe3+/spermidine/putrescine transport system ATPase subunit